jgi:hypothetical protein
MRHGALPYPNASVAGCFLVNDTALPSDANLSVVIPRPASGRWFVGAFYSTSPKRTSSVLIGDGYSVTVSLRCEVEELVSSVIELVPDIALPVQLSSSTTLLASTIGPGVLRFTFVVLFGNASVSQVCSSHGSVSGPSSLCVKVSDQPVANITVDDPAQGRWFFAIMSNVTVSSSVTAKLNSVACSRGSFGPLCNGTLARVLGGVVGDSWRIGVPLPLNHSSSWIFFPIDLTNVGIIGQTLYTSHPSKNVSSNLLFRLGCAPTESQHDFSFNRSTSTISIVDPVLDVWYAGVHAGPLPENGTLSINVWIGGCPNDCNGHGCSRSWSNNVLRTKCSCGLMRGGDECLYVIRSNAQMGLEVFLLVATNVAILPAAILAYRRRYWLECFIFFLTGLCSSLYHLCDEGIWCIGVYAPLQFSDFFFAFSSVVVVVFALTGLPTRPRIALDIVGVAIEWALMVGDRTNPRNIFIVVGMSVATVLISWSVALWIAHLLIGGSACSRKSWEVLRTFFGGGAIRLHYLVLGLGIVAVSVICTFLQTSSTYFALHSIWHVCVMLGAWLILLSISFTESHGIYGRGHGHQQQSPSSTRPLNFCTTPNRNLLHCLFAKE